MVVVVVVVKVAVVVMVLVLVYVTIPDGSEGSKNKRWHLLLGLHGLLLQEQEIRSKNLPGVKEQAVRPLQCRTLFRSSYSLRFQWSIYSIEVQPSDLSSCR